MESSFWTTKGILSYANRSRKLIIGLKEEQTGQVSHSVRLLKLPGHSVWIATQNSLDEVVVREMKISYPEHRHVRIYAVPIEDSSVKTKEEKFGLTIVITDVTEEKVNLEARLESEKISSIMDLAAEVAHELGNPLNSIHIHLQVCNAKKTWESRKPIF